MARFLLMSGANITVPDSTSARYTLMSGEQLSWEGVAAAAAAATGGNVLWVHMLKGRLGRGRYRDKEGRNAAS